MNVAERVTQLSRHDAEYLRERWENIGSVTVEIAADGIAHYYFSMEAFCCDFPECPMIGALGHPAYAVDLVNAHTMLTVAMPSHRIVPTGSVIGPNTGECVPKKVCCTWLAQYNAERDERADWNRNWRYTCVGLAHRYPLLRSALGAFKLFARQYLAVPCALPLMK